MKKLSDIAHYVTQKQGTEQPFSGAYYNHKELGNYHCVCCQKLLFSSQHKYDSGTGWPSFYDCATPNNISKHCDNQLAMTRTEVKCKHCQAHLGHLFDDGPMPTGKRYCINSAALTFKASD